MKGIARILSTLLVAAFLSAGEGTMKTEKATFAAGCFWGVEAAFQTVHGVIDTRVGYTGGQTPNPTYRDVCSGTTGHAEALEITFAPSLITYSELVDLFWRVHDPTQLNRQGPDRGTQYRSAIFFHSAEQKTAAENSMAKQAAASKHRAPIVTQIVPAGPFYSAEEYHQQYLKKTGAPACHFFD